MNNYTIFAMGMSLGVPLGIIATWLLIKLIEKFAPPFDPYNDLGLKNHQQDDKTANPRS